MNTSLFVRWRSNFWAGMAIVLPVVISVGLLIWLFGTVANITDLLLFFLPWNLTHSGEGGQGPMYWYWSLVALGLAICLISVIGLLARNYLGKRIIQELDLALLRVPLLNKIYGAIKQVNAAFSAENKTAFKTVVLIEFPRAGVFSLGFITSEQQQLIQLPTREKAVCVFVPTTPNPTGGYLLLVPEDKITKLEMSVADGLKYVVSLGALFPEAGYSQKLPCPVVVDPKTAPHD